MLDCKFLQSPGRGQMPDSLAILICLAYLDIKESSKNCTVGLYLEALSVPLSYQGSTWLQKEGGNIALARHVLATKETSVQQRLRVFSPFRAGTSFRLFYERVRVSKFLLGYQIILGNFEKSPLFHFKNRQKGQIFAIISDKKTLYFSSLKNSLYVDGTFQYYCEV